MRQKLLLVMAFLITGILFSVTAQSTTPSLGLAEGHWEVIPNNDPVKEDWEKTYKCGDEPLIIKINPEKNRYSSKRGADGDVRTATILNSTETSLTIKYDEEERIMDNGELHVWKMVFRSDNVFYWVRHDWIDDGETMSGTRPRRRCTLNVA